MAISTPTSIATSAKFNTLYTRNCSQSLNLVRENYGVGGLDWLVSKLVQSKTRSSIKDFQIKLRAIRAVASGGVVVSGSAHLKLVSPHFTFGPPVAAYIQYCILKMWSPLLTFGPSFWFLASPAAKSWRRACVRGRRTVIGFSISIISW